MLYSTVLWSREFLKCDNGSYSWLAGLLFTVRVSCVEIASDEGPQGIVLKCISPCASPFYPPENSHMLYLFPCPLSNIRHFRKIRQAKPTVLKSLGQYHQFFSDCPFVFFMRKGIKILEKFYMMVLRDTQIVLGVQVCRLWTCLCTNEQNYSKNSILASLSSKGLLK